MTPQEPYLHRANASEREAIQKLNIAYNILCEVGGILDERARNIDGMKRDMGLLRSLFPRILSAFYLTLPDEQRRKMAANDKLLGYTCGLKAGFTKHRNAEYGVVVSYDELEKILDALEDHCITCGRDKAEMRVCPLKKTLDDIGCDIDHGDGCGYRVEL